MNGWKNYQTWTVWNELSNDEGTYRAACDFMRTYKGRAPYSTFIIRYVGKDAKTYGGVKWLGSRLDYPRLNEAMRELV